MAGSTVDVSRETSVALTDVGGRFMTAAQMDAAAKALGLPRGAILYFRGRIGAVGEVSGTVAASLIGIFPPRVMAAVWAGTAALPAAAAVPAYVGACAEWGRAELAGLAGADRVAELAERVVDAAEPSALPLFAGLRGTERPADPPARMAHALMLLRELRGGLHFAALRARGIDVPLAIMADPRGGPARLRRLAWDDAEVAALEQRAGDTADLRDRWDAAEQATTAAFADALDVLPAAEVADLGAAITAAETLSRPH
jgi:hypothetical protein